MRRSAAIALKLCISILLVWLVARHVDLESLVSRLGQLGWLPIGAVAAASLAQIPLTALRWNAILAALGTGPRFADSLRVTAIGLFFNATLPAVVGGDAVRVFYARGLGVGLRTAIHSVLLDRLSALVALILMAAVGLPWSLAMVTDGELRHGLILAVALGLAGLIGLVLLDGIGRQLARWPLGRAVALFGADCARILRSPRPAAATLTLSSCVHLLDIAKAYVVALALGAPLGLGAALLLVPPVILSAVLPISIAGWGVREVAMVLALGQIGIAPVDALSISIVMGLSQIGLGIPGGLLWLTTGARRGEAANAP
ncbi:MAG: flippase-like domain-containing protein [Rhodospirillaceae bacterium]|nr:flippase-like domain-containing protein [Rhodospirillaceae bacterium]MBT6117077.1 flippase-like domain-containing protein [Rhodospirillaceae bacterium]